MPEYALKQIGAGVKELYNPFDESDVVIYYVRYNGKYYNVPVFGYENGQPIVDADVLAERLGLADELRVKLGVSVKEKPHQIAGQDNLGYLSGIGESNNDPSIISSGKGDIGGKSYGAFQFASNVGIPLEFVKWLDKNNNNMYNILINAYNADGKTYGINFDSAWREIGRASEYDFLKMQYIFGSVY